MDQAAKGLMICQWQFILLTGKFKSGLSSNIMIIIMVQKQNMIMVNLDLSDPLYLHD